MTRQITLGRVSPRNDVPASIPRPPYVGGKSPRRASRPHLHSPAEVERLRAASRVASDVLAAVAAEIRPGVTTGELDELAHAEFLRHGAYPSTLGYGTYPKSICTSINEVICHGIPDSTALEDGDLLSVDVTAYFDGMHGDLCQTFAVGEVSDEARELMDTTLASLEAAIEVCRPGAKVNEIGAAIQRVAEPRFHVVREFVGHEIGSDFHGCLVIAHFYEPRDRMTMAPGMCFTIEPMLAAEPGGVVILDDGWTAITSGRALAAQFEHTVLIIPGGCEILTRHAPEPSA